MLQKEINSLNIHLKFEVKESYPENGTRCNVRQPVQIFQFPLRYSRISLSASCRKPNAIAKTHPELIDIAGPVEIFKGSLPMEILAIHVCSLSLTFLKWPDELPSGAVTTPKVSFPSSAAQSSISSGPFKVGTVKHYPSTRDSQYHCPSSKP